MSLVELGFDGASALVWLNKDERISVATIAIAGGISALATTLLLSHILTVAIFGSQRNRKGARPTSERTFVKTRIGLYISCLMLCGLFGGVAGVLETMWAISGSIYSGPTCGIQGVLVQLSDVGTAVFSTLIAFHTFNTLVLRKRLPTSAVIVTIALAWIFIAVLAGAGPFTFPAFYTNVGLWCWISSAHPYAQLFMHYVPMFLAALLVTILYSVVYFSLRGNLFVDDDLSFTLKRTSTDLTKDEYRRFLKMVAKKMFWYPVVYIALITPISVCRMLNLARIEAPYAMWVAAAVCLTLMGFANAVVYTITRNIGRTTSMAGVPPSFIVSNEKSRPDSIQSFAALEKGGYDSPNAMQSPARESGSWRAITPRPSSEIDSRYRFGVGIPSPRSISPASTAVGSDALSTTKKTTYLNPLSERGSIYSHQHTSSTSSAGTAVSSVSRTPSPRPPLRLHTPPPALQPNNALLPPPRSRMVGRIVTHPRSPVYAGSSSPTTPDTDVLRKTSLVSLSAAVGNGNGGGIRSPISPPLHTASSRSPQTDRHESFNSSVYQLYSPHSPQELPSPVSVYHHQSTKRGGIDSFYVKQSIPPVPSALDYPRPRTPAHPALRDRPRPRSRSMTALSATFIQQEIEKADQMDMERDFAMEKRLSKYRDVQLRTLGALRRPSISQHVPQEAVP